MFWAALSALAIAATATVADASPVASDPLWQAEISAGYGIAIGGSGTTMSRRPTPLTLEATVSFAFNEDPPLFGYGGLAVETLDRTGAGAVFGVQLKPHGSTMHLSGGGIVMAVPDMLYGVTASGGTCRSVAGMGLCGDLQLTAFFAGGDLAPGRAVTEAQLVLGMVFDVL